jgi:hypothetical protein
LFAGQQVWANAQPVFNQLVSDLTNHAGDAVTIVAQAIASLNQVIGGAGNFFLLNFLRKFLPFFSKFLILKYKIIEK